MTIDDLITALEKATEPSRELFDEIGAFVERADPNFSRFLFDAFVEAGAYLDAALTLVLEGLHWSILNHGCHDGHEDEDGIWHIDKVGPMAVIHASPLVSAIGATHAIALCSAALKARKK